MKWLKKLSIATVAALSVFTIGAQTPTIFRSIRIQDASLADSATFSHDGTDFTTAFTNTSQWTISGLSGFGGGMTPGVDIVDTELYVTGPTFQFPGVWAESALDNGEAYSGVGNTESNASVWLSAFGSSAAEWGAIANYSRLIFANASPLPGLSIQGLSGGVASGRYQRLWLDSTTKRIDIQDATRLRIFDGAETDSVELYHTGTTFNTAFTNTTAWNITSTPSLSFQGPANSNSVITTTAEATGATRTAAIAAFNANSNNYVELGATGTTEDHHYIYFSSDQSPFDIVGDGGAAGGFLSLSRPVTTKFFDIADATHLRIFDDAETDYADFYHDGTRFQTDFVNTSGWRINTPTIDVNLNGASSGYFAVNTANATGIAISAVYNSAGTSPGTYMEMAAYGATHATYPDQHRLYFNDDLGPFTLYGENGDFLTLSQSGTALVSVLRGGAAGAGAVVTLSGTEADLTATTLDLNGNLDLAGTTHAIAGTTTVIDSGTGDDELTITADTIAFNGAITGGASGGIDMTPVSGTFTATFDDACATSPTVGFAYYRIGNVVTLTADTGTGFTCTGDSNNFATTGTPVPSTIRPVNVGQGSYYLGAFTDGGTDTAGTVTVLTTGNILFNKCSTFGATCTSSGWTASGNRNTVDHTWSMTYVIDTTP